MATSILEVRNLVKTYTQGVITRKETFRLEATVSVAEPAVVGVMGPNGSGKTTLFELITGSNKPTSGKVLCMGRDIHNVKYRERDRLAIHYHQSYQVRHFKRTKPAFLMRRADSDYPMVHLFDEPQFNAQDGYIGFMLEFFAKLRADGRVVFLCLHPTEPFHLEIMQDICERYIFVQNGKLTQSPNFTTLLDHHVVRDYLGKLALTAA